MNLKLIQYNARSLTKSNLIEFKAHLHLYKPHIVTLCETFWRDSFSVKFKQYYAVNKNRVGQVGGGVAILIHKSLQFKQLQLPDLQTIESIGVSISTENNGRNEMLDIISIYIPNGQACDEDELTQLHRLTSNNTIFCGDYNARHGLWDTRSTHPNRSGRILANLLEKENNIMLATPPNLGTRQCPSTLKFTTIDLAIMSPHLAATAELKRGPFIGSDHLPIHIQLVTKPMQSSNRPPSWNFSEANWENWNTSIRQTIELTDFHRTGDPSRKYQIFISALHSANTANNIKMKKTSNQMKAEPQRAWWTKECKKAVAQSRKARNACDPARGGVSCESNKAVWREKEIQKKKTIIKAKKKHRINTSTA